MILEKIEIKYNIAQDITNLIYRRYFSRSIQELISVKAPSEFIGELFKALTSHEAYNSNFYNSGKSFSRFIVNRVPDDRNETEIGETIKSGKSFYKSDLKFFLKLLPKHGYEIDNDGKNFQKNHNVNGEELLRPYSIFTHPKIFSYFLDSHDAFHALLLSSEKIDYGRRLDLFPQFNRRDLISIMHQFSQKQKDEYYLSWFKSISQNYWYTAIQLQSLSLAKYFKSIGIVPQGTSETSLSLLLVLYIQDADKKSEFLSFFKEIGFNWCSNCYDNAAANGPMNVLRFLRSQDQTGTPFSEFFRKIIFCRDSISIHRVSFKDDITEEDVEKDIDDELLLKEVSLGEALDFERKMASPYY